MENRTDNSDNEQRLINVVIYRVENKTDNSDNEQRLINVAMSRVNSSALFISKCYGHVWSGR